MSAARDRLWVFGYGSLMWRPGFSYERVVPARLYGYHRAMCVLSSRYRGCAEKPGLVLGLDRGGCCLGRAFLTPQGEEEATQTYLYDREMITKVYRPLFLPVRLEDSKSKHAKVSAYCFVVERDHPQYCKLTDKDAAKLVSQGVGEAGTSLDYLEQTVRHMDELGIREGSLHRLLALTKCMAETSA